jgi:hypothetical protein
MEKRKNWLGRVSGDQDIRVQETRISGDQIKISFSA